jgi:hypothetical protein
VTGPPSGLILIVVVVIAINLALAVAVANYGRSKGFPFTPILVASMFFSVVLVWLIVALMPARNSTY